MLIKTLGKRKYLKRGYKHVNFNLLNFVKDNISIQKIGLFIYLSKFISR